MLDDIRIVGVPVITWFNAWAAANAPANQCHLYKAAALPTDAWTLADFQAVECDFSGYTPAFLIPVPQPMIPYPIPPIPMPLSADVGRTWLAVSFTHDAGLVANDVGGYWIQDASFTEVMYYRPFLVAYGMHVLGENLTFAPRFDLGNIGGSPITPIRLTDEARRYWGFKALHQQLGPNAGFVHLYQFPLEPNVLTERIVFVANEANFAGYVPVQLSGESESFTGLGGRWQIRWDPITWTVLGAGPSNDLAGYWVEIPGLPFPVAGDPRMIFWCLFRNTSTNAPQPIGMSISGQTLIRTPQLQFGDLGP